MLHKDVSTLVVLGPQYYHANAVSFRYEGTSSPDIKMSNGTKIDPCRSQWKYPCFNYDSQAKIVDLLSDQCENLMQFKIFGTPGKATCKCFEHAQLGILCKRHCHFSYNCLITEA